MFLLFLPPHLILLVHFWNHHSNGGESQSVFCYLASNLGSLVYTMEGWEWEQQRGWAILWLKPNKWDALGLVGLVKYAAFLHQERPKTSSLFLLCVHWWGANINYASSSTASNHALSNSHSCECIGPLRVSNQSEHNLRSSAQRSCQQLC